MATAGRQWREHLPDVVAPLLVPAGREEFDRGVADGRPPVLLKDRRVPRASPGGWPTEVCGAAAAWAVS